MRKFTKTLIVISSTALLSGVGANFLASCQSNENNININPSIKILNGESAEIKIDEYFELNIEKKDLNGTLKYSSSDETVAIVSSTGRVYGIKEGEAIIKAYIGDYFDTIVVKVTNNSSTNEPSINIVEGEEYEVELGTENVVYFNTTNFDGVINATLSLPGIIEISDIKEQAVVFKAIKEGTTTLTLSINDNIKDSIKIIVTNNVVKFINISLSQEQVKVGQDVQINVDIEPSSLKDKISFYILNGRNLIEINDFTIHTLKSGCVTLYAFYNGFESNQVCLTIHDFDIKMDSLALKVGEKSIIQISNYDGELLNLDANLSDSSIGKTSASYDGFYFTAIKVGNTKIYLYDNYGNRSNQLSIDVINDDPYGTVTKEEFYNDYKRAPNYIDAMYRSKHNFMSGDISAQDQKPTISLSMPKVGNKFVHNSDLNYTNGGKTYVVPDVYGNKAFEIYEGAAYATLEEVAAYVYAFGDVPINYSNSKNTRPYNSPWKEYLRVNHSPFSGSTTSYPFEPVLPDISGCGGNLEYYEIDIGTTGTDCDPSYPSKIYNDGNRITRGAARIVYSRFYEDTGKPVIPEDRYVFYTYNHYNDFQEYLNYENGWGEMFGNITGGGVLSSKNPSQCNPTPYVETVRKTLK